MTEGVRYRQGVQEYSEVVGGTKTGGCDSSSDIYVGLSIESMHYMMSSTLYRVHWSKIHYTESRSPLSFDQLHPAAQSPIRSTLFLQVPYSRSRSPVYPVTPSCVLCPKENTFSVLLASWQRIPFFTSAMAANSAVQLLTVICLELTKEDKETFKIKSAKRLVVL